MSTIDISLIIPVFKVEEYITECIQSVMRQDNIGNLNIECLIVDDKTPDKSIEIARALISQYNGPITFRIIERPINGGLSAARNTGIRASRGKYLLFIDSDDFISSTCLFSLWNIAEKHNDAEIVYGITECYPDNNVRKNYFDLRAKGTHPHNYIFSEVRRLHLEIPETAWNKLINRSWLIQNNLFFKEGILNEDLEWHLRAYFAITQFCVAYDSAPHYFYRQREGSIMANDEIYGRLRRKSEIITSCAEKAPGWDNLYFKYLCAYILPLKFATKDEFYELHRNYYKKDLRALYHSKPATPAIKLLLRYLSLPKSLVKARILHFLIDFAIRKR